MVSAIISFELCVGISEHKSSRFLFMIGNYSCQCMRSVIQVRILCARFAFAISHTFAVHTEISQHIVTVNHSRDVFNKTVISEIK